MSLAYAASQSGEHGAEPNVGDVILHHVLDTKILSIKILGLDLSITKHVFFVMLSVSTARYRLEQQIFLKPLLFSYGMK